MYTYKIVGIAFIANNKELEKYLNSEGKEAWQLVCIYKDVYCIWKKRIG